MNESKAATPVATDAIIQYTAEIVSAYVSRNPTTASDVPSLVVSIHNTLRDLSGPHGPDTRGLTVSEPAVPIRKSVTPDAIICLECGKRFAAIRRHLGTAHGLTPERYREKWRLPPDYPLITANYSQARSDVAKATGLGRRVKGEPIGPAPGKRTGIQPGGLSRASTGRSPKPTR